MCKNKMDSITEGVVAGYKKIEDTVVNGAVEGFGKVVDKCVEDAKKRLSPKEEQK